MAGISVLSHHRPQPGQSEVSVREWTIINLASRGSFHTLQHPPKNDIKEYLGVES